MHFAEKKEKKEKTGDVTNGKEETTSRLILLLVRDMYKVTLTPVLSYIHIYIFVYKIP